ncbi:MAG TPA: type II toxin-antitoxin system RelE/ParE family toxin [Dehalococcoidia bacterium]|nr:type II toxin-antitoxin system RelE/ParE family toxin [Dehalococcoidia bacterium]
MPGKEYRLEVTRSARKDLVGLPEKVSRQIEKAIDRLFSRLLAGQRPQDMKTVHGRPHTYRVDTGEYRVLFSLDETAKVITIFRVRHRKHVYRNL